MKNELFGNSEQLDDTISRREALDALTKQADEMSRWCERYQEQRKGVLTARNIIKDLPSAQQWIPVTEKLPEMTDTYLVQVSVNENGEGMHTEARTAEWNAVWQKWYVHTTRCLVGDIIKWMPIPWEGSDRHEG